MGSATGLMLLGAAIVSAVGGIGVWLALKRPAQALKRRRRSEALAASELVTPAARVSSYGAAPDPCAPDLSDAERVEAMRALLLRGDKRSATTIDAAAAPGQMPQRRRDDPMTTSPMAWNPTLPPDEAEAWEAQRSSQRPRVREADHEHITV